MKASNLKALLITAFCFLVALCSEIGCMDTASDIQEPTSYKAQNNSLHDSMLPLAQDDNETPSASWVSYASYPVKAVIHGTYNIADFAVKHPTQTIVTSLIIAAQFTAVAADFWGDVGDTVKKVATGGMPGGEIGGGWGCQDGRCGGGFNGKIKF